VNENASHRGFHTATMQDVIKESGLSAGAIYNHFASKEDIIIAIANERHVREAQTFAAAAAESDVSTAAERLIEAFFQQSADPGQEQERRVGVQYWAEALNNRKLHKIVQQGTLVPKKVLGRLIERLKISGDLPEELDSEAMAHLMIALFKGFVLQKCREPDLDVDDYVSAIRFVWGRLHTSPKKVSRGRS
jgi:AcrR family transcriptional regulator